MRDLSQDIWALAVPGKKTVLGRGRLAGMQAIEAALLAAKHVKEGEFRGWAGVRKFIEGDLDSVYGGPSLNYRLDIVEIPK